MANHDSRWSDRRNVDHRLDYGNKQRDQSSRQVHYDHYDPYDSTGEGEYGSREYPDGYEQPTDLYENVPAARNIARIQITADEVEERRQPQQRYKDYEQHTIDRPYKGGNGGNVAEPRREERRMESQRRAEIEKNAEKSRQQAENRRREEVEKARRAELEREEEKRRVEAERQRQMEERKRQEQLRKQQQQQQQQQQQPREQSQQRREPHLRYEPSPVPFHGQKQGIIDGFQASPNKQKITTDYREEDYRPQAKKNDIPPAPPAPKSIKAIINNLKGNQESQKQYKADDGRNDIPRNKVSTNPFVRAGDKAPPSPARTPDQPIKNVQEVVQKMNSGEWPIRVEEEEIRHKQQQFKEREQPARPRSQPSFDQPKQVGGQKARQWEELDRGHSPDHRQNERRGSHSDIGPQRRAGSVRDLVREADEEQRRHESEFSERSENGEVTTVSTDSAMGSDGSYNADTLQLPFELPHGTVIRKLPGNVKELNEEAEKLLLYFKGHRSVLNYLGIGLSETLWTHIHALPEANAEIIVEIPRVMPMSHSPKKAPPQITVTQPAFSPKPHREQPSRSPDRRHQKEQQQPQKPQPSRPAQVASQKQLLTVGRH